MCEPLPHIVERNPSTSSEDNHISDNITDRFVQLVTPKDNINLIASDKNTHEFFTTIWERIKMISSDDRYRFDLIKLVESDLFRKFYHDFIDYVFNFVGSTQISSTYSTTSHLTLFSNLNQIILFCIKTRHDNLNANWESISKLFTESYIEKVVSLIKGADLSLSFCATEIESRNLVHTFLDILRLLINMNKKYREILDNLQFVDIIIPLIDKLYTYTQFHPNSEVQLQPFSISCLFLLIYLMNESQSKNLSNAKCHWIYLIKIFDQTVRAFIELSTTSHGYSLNEFLKVFHYLAGPDHIKQILVRLDILSTIKNILISVNEKYQTSTQVASDTLELLWLLLFVKENQFHLHPDSELYGLINRFTERSFWTDECVEKAQGILWTLTAVYHIKEIKRLRKNNPCNSGHIIICYEENALSTMQCIYNELSERGFLLWMDTVNKKDSYKHTMIDAFQNARGLILAMSSSLKNTAHCRQVVRNACYLRLPLYPILLEHGFQPDGWLGYSVPTLIYSVLTKDADLNLVVSKLAESIKSTDQISTGVATSSIPKTKVLLSQENNYQTNESPVQDFPVPILNWTNEMVINWFNSQNLSNYTKLFCELDGNLLVELISLRMNAPESLVTSLYEEFDMKLMDQLKFFRAIRPLLKWP